MFAVRVLSTVARRERVSILNKCAAELDSNIC